MTHALKTWPEYFEAISSGFKTFEVRKDDRKFNSGDVVLLQEYDNKTEEYTGAEWTGEITYIMRDPAFVKKGFVIFGIKEIESPYH